MLKRKPKPTKPFIVLLIILTVGLSAAPSFARSNAPVILVVGDSLVAGYGISKKEAFPAQLQDTLRQQGIDTRVINAGIPGETAQGTSKRLAGLLQSHTPDITIIVTGGNDILRKNPPEETKRHLRDILDTLDQHPTRTLLAGMEAPITTGITFSFKFNGIYEDLADEYNVAFYPNFLEGVLGEVSLNVDQIHPNVRGVQVVVGNIAPLVVKLIDSL